MLGTAVKDDLVSIGTVFLLTLAVCVAFTNSAWALSDYVDEWSSNNTARSYATGAYGQIGNPYSPQVHEGNITEGNVIYCAYTRFFERNQTDYQVFDSLQIYLCNNSGSKETYTHQGIYFIRTWTHSYYDNTAASLIDVEIGPPGVQK